MGLSARTSRRDSVARGVVLAVPAASRKEAETQAEDPHLDGRRAAGADGRERLELQPMGRDEFGFEPVDAGADESEYRGIRHRLRVLWDRMPWVPDAEPSTDLADAIRDAAEFGVIEGPRVTYERQERKKQAARDALQEQMLTWAKFAGVVAVVGIVVLLLLEVF